MDKVTELIELVKYIILGIVQGFTEPIPISSSGHVLILRELFNVHIQGLSFEIIVNFGSLIAVCLVYRHDILRIMNNSYRFIVKKDQHGKADFQFVVLLVIATMITGILGLFLEDYISGAISSNMKVIGATLLITGVALWLIRNLRGRKNDGDLTLKDAIIIGLAQTVALIPGISRSGATIVAAMLLGTRQETALRFSFLLYIPVSLGVTILSVDDIVSDPYFDTLIIPYLLAFIAAGITSFYALKWFMNIMAKGNLKYFSYYCFIVGILVILFL